MDIIEDGYLKSLGGWLCKMESRFTLFVYLCDILVAFTKLTFSLSAFGKSFTSYHKEREYVTQYKVLI